MTWTHMPASCRDKPSGEEMRHLATLRAQHNPTRKSMRPGLILSHTQSPESRVQRGRQGGLVEGIFTGEGNQARMHCLGLLPLRKTAQGCRSMLQHTQELL